MTFRNLVCIFICEARFEVEWRYSAAAEGVEYIARENISAGQELVIRYPPPACGKLCTIYQDLILILQSAKILKYFQNFPKYQNTFFDLK